MKTIQFDSRKIPSYVRTTAKKLLDAGFESYLVGGAVRDLLVGRKTKDFDIATNALPDQVQEIFPKAILTGAKFGNTIVVVEDKYGERYDVDVTTYRKEENYFGGRWPGKVEFTTQIEEDLSRRDFTINAMAISMAYILKDQDQLINIEQIIDPYFGISDILSGTIRAVRDPYERMGEDGLRAFRACRLASELLFTIEEETQKAIKSTLHVTEKISMERIRDELLKMIKHSKFPSKGFIMMEKLGLLEQIIPELLKGKKIFQPQWHEDDVFTHSLKTMDLAEDSIKIAALFHDIGKVETMSEDETGIHFYGHDVVGAEITKNILQRLRFSNKEVDRISNLVRWHMFYYPSADWRKENSLKSDLSDIGNKHGWTDSAIRRFIKNVGGLDVIDELMKLRIADATANPKHDYDSIELEIFQARIAEVIAKEMTLKVTDLEIDGKDLKIMGFEPGPLYSKILNFLLEKALDDPQVNKKEILIKLIKENFRQ
jgi:tRNA nucleotidyltransferase (CCA-adding enzyme)